VGCVVPVVVVVELELVLVVLVVVGGFEEDAGVLVDALIGDGVVVAALVGLLVVGGPFVNENEPLRAPFAAETFTT